MGKIYMQIFTSILDCNTVAPSFTGSAFIKWETDGIEKEWGEGPPRSFSFLSARPFSLPSFPFDERAWIFDLPAKEETVLQSSSILKVMVINVLMQHLFVVKFVHKICTTVRPVNLRCTMKQIATKSFSSDLSSTRSKLSQKKSHKESVHGKMLKNAVLLNA